MTMKRSINALGWVVVVIVVGLPVTIAGLTFQDHCLCEWLSWGACELLDFEFVFYPLVFVYSAAFWLLWYAAWNSIQDGEARLSPGKAVGLALIPGFNFYWIFRAVPGFAFEYNELLLRHSLPLKKLKPGLFKFWTVYILIFGAFCVFRNAMSEAIEHRRILRGLVDLDDQGVFGVTFAAMLLVYVILTVVVVHRLCRAVNALPAIHRGEGCHQLGHETASPLSKQAGSPLAERP